MGNKSFEMYAAYIDPDEINLKTPAKRLYSVAGPYKATSVSRAMSQFWKEMAEYGWGKRDVVLIGLQPAGLTSDMRKEEEVFEDDALEAEYEDKNGGEIEASEELELDEEDDVDDEDDDESDEFEEEDED